MRQRAWVVVVAVPLHLKHGAIWEICHPRFGLPFSRQGHTSPRHPRPGRVHLRRPLVHSLHPSNAGQLSGRVLVERRHEPRCLNEIPTLPRPQVCNNMSQSNCIMGGWSSGHDEFEVAVAAQMDDFP